MAGMECIRVLFGLHAVGVEAMRAAVDATYQAVQDLLQQYQAVQDLLQQPPSDPHDKAVLDVLNVALFTRELAFRPAVWKLFFR
jgi:hypothetical protein